MIPQYSDGVPQWRCTGGNYDFYPIDEIQDGVKGVKLYFFEIESFTSVSRTVGFIPGLTVSELVSEKPFSEKDFIIVNPLMARTWKAQIKSDHPQSSGLSLRIALGLKSYEPSLPYSTAHCFRDED